MTELGVLVVDDDLSIREILSCALIHHNIPVRTAASGAEAAALLAKFDFHLIVIDLNLPDVGGIELIETVRRGTASPIILISGCISATAAVQAMKLGAIDVIEKPIDLDRFVEIAATALRSTAPDPSALAWPADATMLDHPSSAAARWASYVVKACESDTDLKTLAAWAAFVGVSYSSLCESCRLIRVRPHDARDLARALRAVVKASVYQCDPEVLFDVSDRRTLHTLMRRAGLDQQPADPRGALENMLMRQQFVPHGNAGMRVVCELLQCPSLRARLSRSEIGEEMTRGA
jgi:DNA-binding response OmpR family regulator